ncbi:MAG: hypothetical protein ACLSAF_07915 [Intestinimonas sp.]
MPNWREAVLPQKGQQQAHAHLEPEGVPDLEGPLPGDALDAGEVLSGAPPAR